MDPDIHQTNVRFLVTLVLSTPKPLQQSNEDRSLHLKNVGRNQDNNDIFQHAVGEIFLQEE